jgi:VCBS repeat-containing protein
VITYTISDGHGGTDTAIVTIQVTPVDDLPIAVDDALEAREDTPLSGTLTGNDTPSGDGGNVWAKASDPAHGSVVVNPDGSFVYTPSPDYHGPDSFTYTITDADGDVSTATVTLTVKPVDDLPIAVDDALEAREDTPLSGTLTGNDTPSGDGGNVWAKASDPAHGSVVVNPDGSFVYTPSPDYHGPDSFTYTITDADGDVSTATVTLTVKPVDDLPIAVDDALEAREDTPLSGTLTGNDTPSGDGGNVWAKASDPAHGSVVVNPDGSFVYTPSPDYHGPDSFTYTITDADGDVSTATVTLTVKPVDDLPIAVDDALEAREDTPLSGTLTGNDTPSGDGGNVWAKASDPAHGSVVVNPDGSFVYTPSPDYHGPDSFTYTITDADGDVSTATVTLTVKPVNDPPTGTDKTVTLKDGQPLPLSPGRLRLRRPRPGPDGVRAHRHPAPRRPPAPRRRARGAGSGHQHRRPQRRQAGAGARRRHPHPDLRLLGVRRPALPGQPQHLHGAGRVHPRRHPAQARTDTARHWAGCAVTTGLLLPAVRTALAGATPVPALCPRPARAARRGRRRHRTGHRLGHRPQPGRPGNGRRSAQRHPR